jgi:hypothetical protein
MYAKRPHDSSEYQKKTLEKERIDNSIHFRPLQVSGSRFNANYLNLSQIGKTGFVISPFPSCFSQFFSFLVEAVVQCKQNPKDSRYRYRPEGLDTLTINIERDCYKELENYMENGLLYYVWLIALNLIFESIKCYINIVHLCVLPGPRSVVCGLVILKFRNEIKDAARLTSQSCDFTVDEESPFYIQKFGTMLRDLSGFN